MEEKNEVQNEEHVVEGKKKDDEDVDKGEGDGQIGNET